MIKNILFSLVLLLFTVAFVGATEPILCTADAKICPDGTGVGRIGPNCEFAPCPASETNRSKCPVPKCEVSHSTEKFSADGCPIYECGVIKYCAEIQCVEGDILLETGKYGDSGCVEQICASEGCKSPSCEGGYILDDAYFEDGCPAYYCPGIIEEPLACTMDIKVCPDGTDVGRIGPNCEFEACPDKKTCLSPTPCPAGKELVAVGINNGDNCPIFECQENSSEIIMDPVDSDMYVLEPEEKKSVLVKIVNWFKGLFS